MALKIVQLNWWQIFCCFLVLFCFASSFLLGHSRKELDALSILSSARKKSGKHGFEGAENNPRGGRLFSRDHRNLMQPSEIANTDSTGVQTHSYPGRV